MRNDDFKTLDWGGAGDALATLPPPTKGPGGLDLADPGQDPQNLAVQRWGLVIPEGGEDRVEALKPLVAHRTEQQGAPVETLSFKKSDDVHDWIHDVYEAEAMPLAKRPKYLLLLGDLSEIPLELQLRLTTYDAFAGRLCFDDAQGYTAYANKIVASETDATVLPGVGVVGPNDGTSAMALAHRTLLTPLVQALNASSTSSWTELKSPASSPSPEPLGASAALPGQVLLSVCHGTGAPRVGWSDAVTQRVQQGGLLFWEDSFGSPRVLRATDVQEGSILPRGVWFMHACFGGATPKRSLYMPWATEFKLTKDELERSLPIDKQPFVAALPKALLENPQGPLAVIAHADIAWSFAFSDPSDPTRPLYRRWEDLLRFMLRGDRVGIASHYLPRHSLLAEQALRDVESSAEAKDRRRQAELHLMRADLRSYLLLGDPAARLPVA